MQENTWVTAALLKEQFAPKLKSSHYPLTPMSVESWMVLAVSQHFRKKDFEWKWHRWELWGKTHFHEQQGKTLALGPWQEVDPHRSLRVDTGGDGEEWSLMWDDLNDLWMESWLETESVVEVMKGRRRVVMQCWLTAEWQERAIAQF